MPVSFKKIFGVADKHEKYSQHLPEFRQVPVSTSAQESQTAGPADGSSLFPTDTVIYFDEHRDMVVSKDYDDRLIRPLPLFVISVGFKRGGENEDAIIPLTLHYGPDKTGPIFGYADQIERHATVTLNNHAYDSSAPFATTIINVNAHLTKERCDFEYIVISQTGDRTSHRLIWKQCKGDPEVVALCKTRAIEDHDWCWIDRKNDKGMKLIHEATGEVLAVFVAGKTHSKMNPVRIAAKVRWLESGLWTKELKLAAFMALMTYGEKSRRVGSGPGMM